MAFYSFEIPHVSMVAHTKSEYNKRGQIELKCEGVECGNEVGCLWLPASGQFAWLTACRGAK